MKRQTKTRKFYNPGNGPDGHWVDESMGLGYDSDATVLMTGSPGLDTDTDSEVRMLGYNWNAKLKRREDGVPETYTPNEEPRLERKLLDHDLGECTTVSRENGC